MELYVLVATVFGWMFISKLQRNFVIFTTISVVKAILALFIGWAVMPIYLISYVFRFYRLITKNSRSTKA